MRWITPQELSRIARKSPTADKTVPERTIRHMAAQNRITTKKEGKTWLIDPSSALRAGLYIPPEVLESLKLKVATEVKSEVSREVAKENHIEQKKYARLTDLGVYSELKSLYLAHKSNLNENTKESLRQTIYNLALGFYEYTQLSKAEYFKRARKFLVGAIVEDDLASPDGSSWREQIENSIMPGVVGLIRKQEGARRGERTQFKAKGKD